MLINYYSDKIKVLKRQKIDNNKGYKNIKGNIKIKVMFAHSIKGCRPLGRACGVLIPSPCVNTTPEPFNLKVRRSRLFRFFRRFPQINVGGDSARIPFVEHASRESRVALPPKGRLRQLATPLGNVFRELGHLILCKVLP